MLSRAKSCSDFALISRAGPGGYLLTYFELRIIFGDQMYRKTLVKKLYLKSLPYFLGSHLLAEEIGIRRPLPPIRACFVIFPETKCYVIVVAFLIMCTFRVHSTHCFRPRPANSHPKCKQYKMQGQRPPGEAMKAGFS